MAGLQTAHQESPKKGASKTQCSRHEMPFGAQVLPEGQGVLFRLWAPSMQQVGLGLPEHGGLVLPMQRAADGWFSVVAPQATHGSLYQFQLEDGLLVPDPASRCQPQDVHGPSQVVDPDLYAWKDSAWQGRPWEETVIYELHVGTFTHEGTFQAAKEKLDYLVELGITAIELMPLADFPGERNWGYDGVLLYAPDSRYGSPDDLKDFIDAAHRKGLMVFLDVVYNHFGPDGNYLHCYANTFFDETEHTPWGAAINFQGAPPVREFFIHNALYWLEEYHFDGLRLDAVHAIIDHSTPHILQELAERVRQAFPPERHVHLVLENDENRSCWLTGSHTAGFDAQWNDDFHHAAHVIATGETIGYYVDYVTNHEQIPPSQRAIAHLGRCLTEGFAYQGELSPYRGHPRGESTDGLPLTAFVNFLQNHDQIGNRAFGDRLSKIAQPKAVQALWEVLLLAPSIPLLFMGEEWQTNKPFLFFCDFNAELAPLVTEGRRKEFERFPEFSDPEMLQKIPDTGALETFEASKLDWNQLKLPEHAEWIALCRRLLGVRSREIMPRLAGITINSSKANCNVFESSGLAAQWALEDGTTLKLAANLGPESLTLTGSLLDNMDFGRHDLLYQSTDAVAKLLQSGQMPPWSVIWLVG